jgi:hypothetical protein
MYVDDEIVFGSIMLVRSFVHFDLSISTYAMTRPALLLLLLDYANIGSMSLLQGFLRMDSPLSLSGMS